MGAELWAMGLVVLGTITGAFGPIFLKKASSSLKPNILSVITNKDLIIGLGLYGISTIIFVPALKGGDLSVLYPLVAVGYIWVCLISARMLHEKIGWNKWLGIGLIILGVTAIGVGM